MKEYAKQVGFSLLFLFLFLPIDTMAQSRKQLEKRRKRLYQEIQNTKQLLSETAKHKELTYERYLTIRQQMEMRETLVEMIQTEIASYDRSLNRTADVIESLGEDVERLKADYQHLLKMAYKRKLTQSDLLFLFSSDGFNDAFKRWQYLKQYDKYRKKQALRIIETQNTLSRKIEQQEKKKLEKEKLLASAKAQIAILEGELKTKNKLFKELKTNEKSLRRKMIRKKSDHESLNLAIDNIIKKDITPRYKKKAKPRTSTSTSTSTPKKSTTPSTSLSSKVAVSFQAQRGKLPWPVRGVVSSYFGKQDHPTLRDIIIDNSGIDILVRKSEIVKPVAAGEVVAVRYVPGSDFLIIVQHGGYYTLYSKLKNHTVNKGDQVNLNDELGTVATDSKTGKTELHFEVWRKQKRLNPLSWLIRY